MHSSVGGQLCSFHSLDILNNATYNTVCTLWACVRVFFLLWYILRSGLAGFYGDSMFTLLRSCQLAQVFTKLVDFHTPTGSVWGFLFPHILTRTYHLSCPSRCEVVSRCGFDSHFPEGCDVGCLFIYLLALCIPSLEKYLWKYCYLFENTGLSFCYWIVRAHYTF